MKSHSRHRNRLKHKLRTKKKEDPPEDTGDGSDEQQAPEPILLPDELLKPDDFNVQQCNQAIISTGSHIHSLWNTTDRSPMTIVMNVYTLSIFATDKPDSLINSIDSVFISDIKEIEGAPECLDILSDKEHKQVIPCFTSLELKDKFLDAYEIFQKCADGQTVGKELTQCEKQALMEGQEKPKEEEKAA